MRMLSVENIEWYELQDETCLHGIVDDTINRGCTHCVRDFRRQVEW